MGTKRIVISLGGVNLLDLFATQVWLLNPAFVERIQPIVIGLYNQGKLDIPSIGEHPEREIATTETRKDLVAHIPIWGTMTKKGGMSAEGMQTTEMRISEANNDESVSSLLLDIESNGGTVDGMAALGSAIRDSEKPVIAYVDNIAASAAYWAASQADTIVMNGDNFAEVGSIGALMIHQDSTKMIADKIGKIEIIRAPQSKDKARINPVEKLPNSERERILNSLEVITDEFISKVKSGRGERLNTDDENIFTGKMYNADQAQELGMVDHLGNFESAINIAKSLGNIVKQNIKAA
ncbi:hypothetical protein LCGC14_2276220 [marine sediment metagenome]|uniref:Peptidase S49 domain-containing protein n=1 Tax=marine sediment metagenome TaxID=412755 RepID=A0A0F9CVI8_9ZZZZ